MTTRGSYVHNSMVEFSGCFYAIFSETIHRAFKTRTTLLTKHFHHLPKLYIGFNDNYSPIAVFLRNLHTHKINYERPDEVDDGLHAELLALVRLHKLMLALNK